MAIHYLTRTAAEIEADRRADMERDAYGWQRYREYRTAWDAHHQRMANERAARNPELAARLAEIHTLYSAGSKLTAQVRTANLMRSQDKRLMLTDSYTPYVPSAELPF